MSAEWPKVRRILLDSVVVGWILFANYVYFKQYSPNILAALRRITGILK